MDVGSGRRRSSIGGGVKSGGVVAGSVWESRMKSDEVKGGIKVFNGGGEDNNNNNNNCEENGRKKMVVRKGQSGNLVGVSGKRKTWKGDTFIENPIQIAKEIVNGGGAKKSPVQVLKKLGRSEEIISERSPVQTRIKTTATRSDKDKDVVVGDVHLRKSKSESIDKSDQISTSKNLAQLRKAKSDSNKDFDGSNNTTTLDDCLSVEEKIGSEETCKELDVCQEKVISSETTTTTINVALVKLEPESEPEPEQVSVSVPAIDIDHPQIDDLDEEEVDDEEVEAEEEEEEEEFEEFEEEVEIEKKNSVDIKEINVEEEKPKRVAVLNNNKAEAKKRFNQFNNKTTCSTLTLNKQPPPVIKRATIYSNFTKPTTSSVPDDHYQSFPETHYNNNKLQNLVDLVMWRDVSKSAFVFGIGTFVIVSSSYTQDLSFSFISVISYLGLVYLAAIFLYRAIICRGVIDIDDKRYVVGEEQAVWLLKMVLPYLNEFMLKLKALFSGDPATTMKMAVLLFVLARCGSSITIWKMTKLGFFGVFIIPKVCSSHSMQLTAYGKFWIRRFRDAWDSCSHKKAMAVAIFTLVWNLSSIVARTWAAFMLFVALRYYQQKMVMNDDWVEDRPTAESEDTWHKPVGRREGQRPTTRQVNKAKKGF
ncbi:hypothetical protein Dsin_029246 [Dipteronia sinensis]|uniref:Reticulon-like protein n=1 Tax=Dipteronia sinensis TaxID=43782 RepID=A0AAE0DV75_9ROSI|nr:hypothetical protein Dsin_029246 [Dipteronia sinensis]